MFGYLWQSENMYAIVTHEFGEPSVMTWEQVDTPKPAPGEVLVKTVAAGVNRADLLQRQGHYPPPKGVTDVIGLEASGIVEAVGEGVTSFSPGDEVVALLAGGGYAEYFTAPAGQLVGVPEGVDLVDAAALIEVAATVVSNLDHVWLKAGETFLVHGGTGGIGAFAIQYAKNLGCKVASTSGTAQKMAQCLNLGADIALDYHDDWVKGIKEATDGRGADVILDVMGAKYLPLNVDALAKDGRLVVIGLQGGRKGELDLNKLLTKRAWVTATSLRFRPTEGKAEICRRVAEEVWPMYAKGELKLPTITRFPVTEAAEAHRKMEAGEIAGKVVLTI